MKSDNSRRYEQRLMVEKEKLKNTLNNMDEHGLAMSQREEVDELSMYDNHPADMGTEMFDKERRYALVDNEEHILSQIDNALERIREGTYGKCEMCGKEIENERLDFIPYATTCVECENKRPDYNTYRYDRPVEEEILPPFGSAFRDYTEEEEAEVEYNMEDSWQDVAKYEKRPHTVRNFDDIDYESEPDSDPEADAGIVEFTDKISNQQYKNQLP